MSSCCEYGKASFCFSLLAFQHNILVMDLALMQTRPLRFRTTAAAISIGFHMCSLRENCSYLEKLAYPPMTETGARIFEASFRRSLPGRPPYLQSLLPLESSPSLLKWQQGRLYLVTTWSSDIERHREAFWFDATTSLGALHSSGRPAVPFAAIAAIRTKPFTNRGISDCLETVPSPLFSVKTTLYSTEKTTESR